MDNEEYVQICKGPQWDHFENKKLSEKEIDLLNKFYDPCEHCFNKGYCCGCPEYYSWKEEFALIIDKGLLNIAKKYQVYKTAKTYIENAGFPELVN